MWALGDCASVPGLHKGGSCPPTAQHAIRQASFVARNIISPFGCPGMSWTTLSGCRNLAAQIFGILRLVVVADGISSEAAGPGA